MRKTIFNAKQSLRERLYDVRYRMSLISSYFDALPDYWIDSWDGGISFCREHALQKIEELKAAKPDGDYQLDGGWPCESDHPRHCETCAALLDYTLTDYGAEQELQHYAEHGIPELTPENAFLVYTMLAALDHEGPHPKELRKVVRRCEKALQKHHREAA